MANKDKLPSKTQFQINKEMLDEMNGKPGTPVKPPKSTGKSKDKIDKELPPPLDSKVAGQLEPSDKAPAQKWDAYSQGEWRCNDCDTTFKHFQPLLSAHMKQYRHNFSLYDRETGEKKASSLSEARSLGHFGNFSKGGKAKKRKNKPAQIGAGTPPPAAQQKQSPPGPGDTQLTPEPPPPQELPGRVAQFMANNPDLVQWLEEHPGEVPPERLTNLAPEGNPQPGSPQVLKFVAKTIEVPSILLVFYQMDMVALQEEGVQLTLDEWVEQVIVQFHVDHAEELGFAEFINQYMEGRGNARK